MLDGQFSEIKVDPNIAYRSKKWNSRKAEARANPESDIWQEARGDYSQSFNLFEKQHVRTNPYELIGTEKALTEQLLHIAELKKRGNDSTPVVAVDFGGMLGLSFNRISHDDRIRKMIQESKLALVITNINDIDPINMLKIRRASKFAQNDDITLDEERVLRENKDFVHYISSDAAEIRRKTLHLPNGTSLDLRGHIDLLHESFVLQHSDKLDVDLPLLYRELSDYGVMYFYSPIFNDTGLSNMLHLGAKSQSKQESGTVYNIFYKKFPPKLR